MAGLLTYLYLIAFPFVLPSSGFVNDQVLIKRNTAAGTVSDLNAIPY